MDSEGHRLTYAVSRLSCIIGEAWRRGSYTRKSHRRRMPSSMALMVVAVAVRLTRCRSWANSVVVVVVVIVMVVMVVMVIMVVMVVMVIIMVVMVVMV